MGGSEALTREALALAILAGVLVLAALLILALRTRALPTCWNCGHESVRRAHTHLVLDYFARVALLYPYRCQTCLWRFYCFHSRHAHHIARAASSGRS